jgi:hypothetical protein
MSWISSTVVPDTKCTAASARSGGVRNSNRSGTGNPRASFPTGAAVIAAITNAYPGIEGRFFGSASEMAPLSQPSCTSQALSRLLGRNPRKTDLTLTEDQ